jgi:hypothetical protein
LIGCIQRLKRTQQNLREMCMKKINPHIFTALYSLI